jgi:hypothetical protein
MIVSTRIVVLGPAAILFNANGVTEGGDLFA